MTLNQKSINLIKSFEGCHLTCYHLGDGVCTIGYGHTRPLCNCHGSGTWSISQEQAETFLQHDLEKYKQAVTNYFTRELNDNQIGALTSFCYNLGTAVFSNYNFPKNGTDQQLTSQMMLFLNKGTPFEEGITRRRKAETALFLDGAVSPANTQAAVQPQLPEEGEDNMIYGFNVEGQGATYIFDGQRTIALAEKKKGSGQAARAWDHYKGTYKEVTGKDIPTHTKTKEQFELWNDIYPAEFIKL